MDKDITMQVSFGDNDGETLPLYRCVCGKEFKPWNAILGIYREYPFKCDCGRELFFKNEITVYEVIPNNEF